MLKFVLKIKSNPFKKKKQQQQQKRKPSTKDESISINFLVCIFLLFERTSFYSEKISNDVCGMVFRENETNHVTYRFQSTSWISRKQNFMFLGIVSNTICFHFAEEFVEKDGFHG